MANDKPHNADRRHAPLGEFDTQLWPILLLVAVLSCVSVAIVVTSNDFPNPLSLDWLSFDSYTTGWGRLGVTIGLVLIAFAAVAWLQKIVARRVLFCVTAGLLVHVLLGLFLHYQYLAILIQRQMAESQEPGERPVELNVPDYHVQSLEKPEERQAFETPVASEKAELDREVELEQQKLKDAPDVELQRHETELEREPTEVELQTIERQQVELQDAPKPLPAPRTLRDPTPRAAMRPTPLDMPAPAPRRETQATRPEARAVASAARQSSPAPMGRMPDGASNVQAVPRETELVVAEHETFRPSEHALSELDIPRAAPAPSMDRMLPTARPSIDAPDAADMAAAMSAPTASEAPSASASNIYAAIDTGALRRRTDQAGPPTSNALASGATSTASTGRLAVTGAAAAPLAMPAAGGLAGGSSSSELLADVFGGSPNGGGAPFARAMRTPGLPGGLAGAVGAGDQGDGAGAGAEDATGKGASIGDLASIGGPIGMAPGRRAGGLAWDGTGFHPDTTTGGGELGGGEDGDTSADATSGAGRMGVELGSLGGRHGDPDGGVQLTGLSIESRVPRRFSRGLNRTPVNTTLTDVPGDAFWHRQPQFRQDIAIQRGGTPETEAAVERALAYFARQQFPDGRWALDRFHDESKAEYEDAAPGNMNADTAATGLALLAFLGAGHTHQDGKYRDVVRKGIAWLVAYQGADGRLYFEENDRTVFARTYGHGIAAIALCECYGMTRDPSLREPAQRAVRFIVDSQHPELGGWRYEPRFESDTSVSGWQLMALTSARLGGLDVPQETLDGVSHWLNVAQYYEGSQYAYNPNASDDESQRHGRRPNLPMTAEGLLMRVYLGADRKHPAIQRGGDYIVRNLPSLGTSRNPQRDVYYWYLATQVMYQLQDEHWEAWNERMRPTVLRDQALAGDLAGSWNPKQPTEDRWSDEAGRHYVTAMHTLMLEVYYRYLPIYEALHDE